MPTGTPIGHMYAEVGLDYTPYTRAQRNLLKSATQTSLKIEKAYTDLGIKSNKTFDLMRAKIHNAYERISKDARSSADEILRAEKAKNAKLKQINEQQYGEQKSFIQGIRQSWIGATAAIVAAWYSVRKAISAAGDLAKTSARFETLGLSMEVVGRNAGYSAVQMAGFQEKLEETGIAMIGARQSLTRMAQAQLDLTKSAQLARIAQDTAVIGAINSTEAFQQLVYGIQSANVRVLRTIGINVSWEESYKKVAEQLGRTTASFSEAEKAQIRLGAVLEAGKKITGTYEAAMTTAGKKLLSLERYFENLKVQVGEGLLPVLGEVVDETTDFIKNLKPEEIRFMADSIKILAESFWALSKAMLSIPHLFLKIGNMMETEITVIDDLTEKIKQIPSGKTGYPDMSSLIGGPPAGGVAGEDITKADKKRLEDLTDFWRVQYDKRYEIQSNTWQRILENESENLQEAKDMQLDFWQYQIKGTAEAADRAVKIQQEQTKKEKSLRAQGLKDTQYTFNTLMALSQGHHKTIFEISKIAATANAIVSTYAGAAAALDDLPYPYNLAAAASVVAFGLAQVAQIQSQSFDSGGSMGSVGGGAITTTGTGTYNQPSLYETPEQKGNINIYIEGAFVGKEKDLAEYLAELLSDNVEKYDVRLVASHSKLAERTQ